MNKDHEVLQWLIVNWARQHVWDDAAPDIDHKIKLVNQWLAQNPQPGATAEDIDELRRYMTNPDIMDAFIAAARKGTVVNSGERRRGSKSGHMLIIWICNPGLEKFLEQMGV